MSKTNSSTRSWVAVSAQMRNSAGAMGGGKHTKNKRARASAKLALRRELSA